MRAGTQQCLDAGLVDELAVDLVPIVLGDGVRWFENLRQVPVHLGNPTVIEGNAVTHLTYTVTKRS